MSTFTGTSEWNRKICCSTRASQWYVIKVEVKVELCHYTPYFSTLYFLANTVIILPLILLKPNLHHLRWVRAPLSKWYFISWFLLTYLEKASWFVLQDLTYLADSLIRLRQLIHNSHYLQEWVRREPLEFGPGDIVHDLSPKMNFIYTH